MNTNSISCFIAGADYGLKFPYDVLLISALKSAVPESDRAWHKTEYTWLISPAYIEAAVKVISDQTGVKPAIPEMTRTAPVLEKEFLLEYLGATKERNGHRSAYGFVNGAWSAEFPERVLKKFFEKTEEPSQFDQTLYQVLCIFERATEDEIKKAYKRLALQWHPDVCHEPEAKEMFIRIDEARKILTNPELRRRYDAGLYFERQDRNHERPAPVYGYRAPLRCGQVKARGTVRLMRFVVSEILEWEDVHNSEGQVMMSHWPKGAETFQISWIEGGSL